MSTIVIALGGNALGASPAEQRQLSIQAAESIADLIAAGHGVIVAHGNGPQVGMIHAAMQGVQANNASFPAMPLNECVAMSQAYIGYHLQNAIGEQLHKRGIDKQVISIVTQVVVDEADPAFAHPTKPIGGFVSAAEAAEKWGSQNISYIEDSGRGYRQVVPSPSPIRIVECEAIRQHVEAGNIVIAVGGGGIPVLEQGDALVPVEAVIDKDAASARLADDLGADMLFVLTAVEQVAIHYGTPAQANLGQVTVDEMKQWVTEGHFAPGSMLPKVEAALRFVEGGAGRKAVITSLEKAAAAITGQSGTIISSPSAE